MLSNLNNRMRTPFMLYTPHSLLPHKAYECSTEILPESSVLGRAPSFLPPSTTYGRGRTSLSAHRIHTEHRARLPLPILASVSKRARAMVH